MKNKYGKNLRPLFVELQALPHFAPAANVLTEERAKAIAKKFGDALEDTRKDFDYANESASKPVTYGEHKGKFLNAERLYFGYIYDLWYVAACEDAEAARNGDYD